LLVTPDDPPKYVLGLSIVLFVLLNLVNPRFLLTELYNFGVGGTTLEYFLGEFAWEVENYFFVI
jgi:hypothetical protein